MTIFNNRRAVLKAALALPALVLAAPREARASQHNVRIQSMRFAPATLSIKAGDSVRFENKDSAAHTATADDSSFDTDNLRSGKTAAVTFAEKGEFAYFCRWHKGMRGKIIVS